ncbi:hypothetical protein [Oceanobacillus salinisoli]|uniref:hypothetical protein n=1 Tax=Oceanobacillus salinisoli TaxID=2678611 RepID=UPI0012E2E8CB|nr:hypothetical protein [Oceanobacillus salinisoli]
MIREAFGKIFWGFLLVLVEIHFLFIDILPDPVGYYLIYSGISMLMKDYPVGKKASNWAITLCFLSIPSMFISQNEINRMIEVLSLAQFYTTIMAVLKIIVVFYVFQILLEIATKQGVDDLQDWTAKFLKIYMITMIAVQILGPFSMNVPIDNWTAVPFLAAITALILDIMFLVLLNRFKKLENENMNEEEGISPY